MMNKLDLNNELITLRTQFAKAKARAINKLTRKLKTIEHGKTKDPKNAKLDSKTTKLVEELKLLKEATKLDTVKKVFAFGQDPDKVLKLQKSTAEQRAICRLLMNPFLKEAVAVSKKKLDIKADDEEWKKLLFTMGKNKVKKLVKKKKEAQAGVKPETLEEKKKRRKEAKKEKKKELKLLALDAKSKGIQKRDQKDKFDKKRKQFMKTTPAKSDAKPPQDVTPTEKPQQPPKAKKIDGPVGPPKKVTLFPMETAKDNKNYQKKPQRDFSDTKKKWNPEQRAPRTFPPKPQFDSKFQQKPKFEKSSEKLHPSWEAKKAKKPAISEFKGKKTTFE